MGTPLDVGGSLRAVWEVRQAEEQRQYCLGAWQNIIFGVMAALIFAAYGAASLLGHGSGPWMAVLWMPPVLGAYAALAFKTRTLLRLPRPSLPWREVLIGTALFLLLMALLGLAFARGVVRDIPAGMSLVIGTFYILLGLVMVRHWMPAAFGVALAAGALGLLVANPGLAASTLYGIVAAGGGMVAMGLWMLRHPDFGAPPPAAGPGPEPELEQVRETLRGLRGHEAAVRARERAGALFLGALLLAIGGVTSLSFGPSQLAAGAFFGCALIAGVAGVAFQALRGAHA